ncbi:putative membrane protein [Hypnocyclicus thermotrophus]|uniref:Membrane protein n=1 Tax=Hypnocyclicus thermotrophus TaxID=1627895 RepID=A0AA46E0C8_9FUSO|nr:YibE/F family protein [Hypnocyclicus thermotrophus]TDT72470.1 putative membrane protein [Hypnocyclicus thermotrophus]
MKKYMDLIISAILFLILIIFQINFLNQQSKRKKYFKQEFEVAIVENIIKERLEKDKVIDNRYNGSQTLKLKILTGRLKGKEFVVINPMSVMHNAKAVKGIKMIVGITKENGKDSIWVYNYKRDYVVYILGGLFMMLLIMLGKKQGIRSLISLIITGSNIIFIILPRIFAGQDPIMVSIITISITTIISFLLISGYNKKSLSAILGTVGGSIIAGTLVYIAGKLAGLSGVTMDKGQQLLYVARDYNIKIKGLLFVSILIASHGAIMDVGMSIASSASEIYKHKKTISTLELFTALMNIGKDITGTMANTLILAFVGSSLNLMMLIYGYNMQYLQFMNMPIIVTEAINGFAGSIGIISTVPLTALISVILIKKSNINNNLLKKNLLKKIMTLKK